MQSPTLVSFVLLGALTVHASALEAPTVHKHVERVIMRRASPRQESQHTAENPEDKKLLMRKAARRIPNSIAEIAVAMPKKHSHDSSIDSDEVAGSADYEATGKWWSAAHVVAPEVMVKIPPSPSSIACKKPVAVFSIAEIESMVPELKNCSFGIYASKVQELMEHSYCRTQDVHKAHLIYLPAYLGTDGNWPNYGGDFSSVHGKRTNLVRDGSRCKEGLFMDAAKAVHSKYGKPVIVIQQASAGTCSAQHIWVKNNLHPDQYVGNSSISMPPPPSPHCQYCLAHADECWGKPLDSKKYKIGFVGNMARGSEVGHPVRKLMAAKHNPSAGVIIAGARQFDFAEVIHNSKFVLDPRGSHDKTYRFPEAVCAGGVPVLIADAWVPPFNRSLPFESYGIRLKEEDAKGDWIAKLDAYSTADLEGLRAQARKVCDKYLATLDKQVHHILEEAMSLA